MKYSRYAFIFLFLVVTSAYSQSGSWVKVKGFSGGARDAVEAFTIGGKLYLGGGEGNKDFYQYDPISGVWSKKKDLPGVNQARAFGVSFVIGNKGYVALGQDSNLQSAVLNDLWEYDPSSDTWTQKQSFPFHRVDGAFAFVINGIAYVGGGADSVYQGWNEFFSYDPVKNAWTALQPLPFGGIFFPASFVIGNYGYLATGSDGVDLWKYDPSSDSWDNSLTPFPGAGRETAVSFVLNGLAYVWLGESGLATNTPTVYGDMYAYDITTDQWATVKVSLSSPKRGWAMGVAVGDTAYIGFGFDFNSFFNDLWAFSLTAASVKGASLTTLANFYPNPVSDFVSLALPVSSQANVTIYNSLGEKVKSEQIEGNRCDLTALAPGIYNLEITSGDYHASERIVKE